MTFDDFFKTKLEELYLGKKSKTYKGEAFKIKKIDVHLDYDHYEILFWGFQENELSFYSSYNELPQITE